MDTGTKEDLFEAALALTVIGLIIYAFDKGLQKLGLISDSKNEKGLDLATGTDTPLNLAWLQKFLDENSGEKFVELTPASRTEIAKNIRGALGIDYGVVGRADDASVIGQLKRCQNQFQVAQVAGVYNRLYGSDLQTDLKHLSDANLAQLGAWIASLDNGIV